MRVPITVAVLLGIFGILTTILIIVYTRWSPFKHRVIRRVTEELSQRTDTVGKSHLLRSLHGVWLQKDYADALKKERSLQAVHRADWSGDWVVLNIDTRRFYGDALPIAAAAWSDAMPWEPVLWYEADGFRLASNHPDYANGDLHPNWVLANADGDLELIKGLGGDGFGTTTEPVVFVRVSRSVAAVHYGAGCWQGIEAFFRAEHFAGRYHIVNSAGATVYRNVVLTASGKVENHPMTRYRLLVEAGVDAIRFETPSDAEQTPPRVYTFGYVLLPNAIELYRLEYDRLTQQAKLGALAYRFIRPTS